MSFLPDPKHVLIRHENDAISYALNRVPPSKEQYAAMRDAILNPVDEETYKQDLGIRPVIKEGAIQIPPEQFVGILDHVYNTTVQQYRRDVAYGFFTIAGVLLIGSSAYKRGYRKGQADANR